MTIALTLPYPPSVNHYWRHTSRGHFLTPKARQYGVSVQAAVLERHRAPGEPQLPMLGPVMIDITAFPPDHKRRDLDNLLKGALDSLQRAGVYLDDNQIKEIAMRWGKVSKPGWLTVTLSVMG